MATSPSTAPATGASNGSAQVSRRQQHRQATYDEIKALARRQLAEHGPGALSLRAIAREMRMASSALYRYFASYEELIGALCVDAYDSVAEALIMARDTRAVDDHAGRWWALAHAYRRWALDNPADFALIFGTPIPGYQATEQVTGPASGKFATVLFETVVDAAQAGAIDPEQTQTPTDIKIGDLTTQLLPEAATHQSPRLAAITLTAWASLLGYLTAEIFGSLPQLITDPDQLYATHTRTVMLGMGFDPALTKTLPHTAPSKDGQPWIR